MFNACVNKSLKFGLISEIYQVNIFKDIFKNIKLINFTRQVKIKPLIYAWLMRLTLYKFLVHNAIFIHLSK